LSPYDDLRVEFHIEENIAEGKLWRVEPEKGEKLPEWATLCSSLIRMQRAYLDG
jgi:hypothetical protein